VPPQWSSATVSNDISLKSLQNLKQHIDESMLHKVVSVSNHATTHIELPHLSHHDTCGMDPLTLTHNYDQRSRETKEHDVILSHASHKTVRGNLSRNVNNTDMAENDEERDWSQTPLYAAIKSGDTKPSNVPAVDSLSESQLFKLLGSVSPGGNSPLVAYIAQRYTAKTARTMRHLRHELFPALRPSWPTA
jgi:hypothetical protein